MSTDEQTTKYDEEVEKMTCEEFVIYCLKENDCNVELKEQPTQQSEKQLRSRPKRLKATNYQQLQLGSTIKIKKQQNQVQYQYDNPFNTFDGKPKRWETLKLDSHFQISTKYPHSVLNTDGGVCKPCTMFKNNNGYTMCRLTEEDIPLYRLIATQWILKPDGYCNVVDHIENLLRSIGVRDGF